MEIVARAHVGRHRERNEDSVGVVVERGLAVLADGMGGLADGDVASRETVDYVLDELRVRQPGRTRRLEPAVLEAALRGANRHLREVARERGGLMGTTAVVASLDDQGRCSLAFAGDSRAYVYRAGRLDQVSRDHSLVQEMVEHGQLDPAAARASAMRNVITRAVGLEVELQPEHHELVLDSEDLLVLCSDGLWDMLAEAEIAGLLGAQGPAGGLAARADALVEAANRAGGMDNIAVVLARP